MIKLQVIKSWLQSAVAHLLVVIGAIVFYKRAQQRAADAAVEEEWRRITQHTSAVRKSKKAKAREIDEKVSAVGDADLEQRMRDNSSD